MDIIDNILDAVGRTPLVRLNKVVPEGAVSRKWWKFEDGVISG